MSVDNSTLPVQYAVPVLETPRLLMRGYRANDFDTWIAMWQDPAYYRYLTAEPLPREEVWRTLLRSAGHWAVMGYGFWALEEKATGQFIGTVGYLDGKRDIEPPIGGTPEMGWVIAARLHGQGYDTEAVASAKVWGDQHFGGVRTVCLIHPDNAPSLRLAEKFGFREYVRTMYKGEPGVLLERPGQA